jgi:hypothetical protein
MSTRSTLTVRDRKDGSEAYSIYRHSDGYPDTPHGVLKTLRQALSYAWPLPRYEAMDFAAAIIAAWKKPATTIIYRSGEKGYIVQGGNIYFTNGREAHGDTEYHYEIYPDGKGRIAVECLEAVYPNGWNGQREWHPRGKHIHLTQKMQAAPLVNDLSPPRTEKKPINEDDFPALISLTDALPTLTVEELEFVAQRLHTRLQTVQAALEERYDQTAQPVEVENNDQDHVS